MTTRFSLTLDCSSPATLTPFWCEALGYEPRHVIDQYAVLAPSEGDDKPVLFLQGVPEPKVAKNRMHFDLVADDPVSEADRLCRLGARMLNDLQEQGGMVWLVLADPEGNEFCVGKMQS